MNQTMDSKSVQGQSHRLAGVWLKPRYGLVLDPSTRPENGRKGNKIKQKLYTLNHHDHDI